MKAAKYAEKFSSFGWQVFPLHSWVQGKTRWGCSCGKADCTSPAKHPVVFTGVKAATTNATVIAEWWKRWPWANVGIATGVESGLIVLDIDPAAGGNESFDDMIGKFGKLPDTVEVFTGSGGRHIYFRHPGGVIRNSAGKLGPGLDVRGDGGYVVGPGSTHASGGAYGFEASSLPSSTPLADMPTWLLTLVAEDNTPKRFGKTAVGDADVIVEGMRNQYIASLCGTLHRRGVSKEAIAACIQAENSVRVRPPLTDEEITRTVASILSRQGGNAKEWIDFRSQFPATARAMDELSSVTGDMPIPETWKEKGKQYVRPMRPQPKVGADAGNPHWMN